MDNFWLKAEQSALKNLYKKSNKKLNSILFTVDEALLPHFKESLKKIFMDSVWNSDTKDEDIKNLFVKYCNKNDKTVWQAVLDAIEAGYASQLFCDQTKMEFEDDDYEFHSIADMPDTTFQAVAEAIATVLNEFLK